MREFALFSVALLSALFVVVAFFACAPVWRIPSAQSWGSSSDVRVCLGVPIEHLAGAEEAVAMWDRALERWIRVRVSSRDGLGDCDVRVTVVDPREHPGNALGWTRCVGCREVFLARGKYERDVRGVLLHELGHVLGAQHVPGTLMNATYDRHVYECPDAATVAQVAAWHRVDIDLLSWCSR